MTMEIRVDRQQLRQTLEVIVGERNPFSGQRHLTAVESFIEKELASYGLSVQSDYFSYRGKKFRNIIGRQSAQRAGSLIILGAHFDSVQGTPAPMTMPAASLFSWKPRGCLLAPEYLRRYCFAPSISKSST